MRIEHQFGDQWAAHLQRMQREIRAHEDEAYRLDGKAAEQRREADMKRRHAGQLLELITQAEQLPQSVRPYELSEDGTKIIGEVRDAETA